MIQSLGLQRTPVTTAITSVGGEPTAVSRGRVDVIIKSTRNSTFSLKFLGLVLKKLTTMFRHRHSISNAKWPYLENIDLADPDFGRAAKVDCILSTEVCAALVMDGLRRGPEGTPIAQNTQLGWVITGTYLSNDSANHAQTSLHHVSVDDTLSRSLQRFWDIEEIQTTPRARGTKLAGLFYALLSHKNPRFQESEL